MRGSIITNMNYSKLAIELRNKRLEQEANDKVLAEDEEQKYEEEQKQLVGIRSVRNAELFQKLKDFENHIISLGTLGVKTCNEGQ